MIRLTLAAIAFTLAAGAASAGEVVKKGEFTGKLCSWIGRTLAVAFSIFSTVRR